VKRLLLLLPVAAALIFVWRFATPLPLTDEWQYVRAVMQLEDTRIFSGAGLSEVLRLYPTRLGGHWVVVPFLVYWPLSLWAHFDQRAFIGVTLLTFALEAYLFRRRLVRSSLWLFPLVVLLFSPSHRLELLWGWQFTIAFSVVFTIAGLCVADGIPLKGTRRLPRLLAAIALFFCAGWSAGGGFFGFACGLLLLGLKPFDRRFKLTALLLVAAAALLQLSVQHGGVNHAPQPRDVLYVLTALGACVWGSPTGLQSFGLDLRSATGLVFCLALAAMLVRAVRLRALPRLALGLAISLFGFLCIGATALSRDYLANWHLQYTMFAICGAYGAAFCLWQEDRTASSALPFAVICALALGSACGAWQSFAVYGPEHEAFIRTVDGYARGRLMNPGMPKPYPSGSDLTPELILYLSAKHHPVFDDPPSAESPLPAGARFYFDNREVTLPFAIPGGDDPNIVPLTVTLPSATHALRLLAHVGGEQVVLRRISNQGAIPLCANPATACFGAFVLRKSLPAAPQPVSIALLLPVSL
jgi:hypothetical protein